MDYLSVKVLKVDKLEGFANSGVHLDGGGLKNFGSGGNVTFAEDAWSGDKTWVWDTANLVFASWTGWATMLAAINLQPGEYRRINVCPDVATRTVEFPAGSTPANVTVTVGGASRAKVTSSITLRRRVTDEAGQAHYELFY